MAIRPRIVLCPTGASLPPVVDGAVAAGVAAKSGVGVLRIHQSAEDPFRLFPVVGRKRNVVVGFHAGIDAERPLERVRRADQGKSATESPAHPSRVHTPVLKDITVEPYNPDASARVRFVKIVKGSGADSRRQAKPPAPPH